MKYLKELMQGFPLFYFIVFLIVFVLIIRKLNIDSYIGIKMIIISFFVSPVLWIALQEWGFYVPIMTGFTGGAIVLCSDENARTKIGWTFGSFAPLLASWFITWAFTHNG